MLRMTAQEILRYAQDDSAEILRCSQGDNFAFVILSTAKNLSAREFVFYALRQAQGP
jgi:hypothetical protein